VDVPEDERDYRSQPKLQSQQGNLNHRKFMHIIEGGDLRAGPKGYVRFLCIQIKADRQKYNTPYYSRGQVKFRRSLVEFHEAANRDIWGREV
jgi:hypothetical protein